ncbi:MAG: Txe/YoeB family addiction module toxin [Coriobacteriales bacterium]|jgi:toxin YoeB|nr:Txe/YoeB family addiction module toxin [Coriobacteriales bacterium]
MPITFDNPAWVQYTEWQELDKKTLRKINKLLKSIQRDGINTIGKVERLKGDLSGFYSARIDEKNRLVFYVVGDDIVIVSCSGHYE